MVNAQLRKFIGWAVLLVISITPVFLWYFLGPGPSEFTDYTSITHSLGELFALVGMTMFALTFLLSTRITFIEDIFEGLDKVYLTHGILGGTALILILFHPIFLVLKFIPNNLLTAANYLLPSSAWSVNFGIIALLGLILLIFITLFTKMKYHRWKFTHEFMGLVFFFAVLHTFLVRGTASKDYIFQGYYIYASIVSFIGLFCFCYSLFLKNRLFKNAEYKVNNIKKYKDSFEIFMLPEHKPIHYNSGQFIFVRLHNQSLSKEAHPFSIASKSNDPELKLVIKKLGDYTNKLEGLKVGDKVSIEGPYGRFNYKEYINKDQVWLAGGIGIVPFLGMVEDLDDILDQKHKVDLYYSAKSDAEFIGADLLERIGSKTKDFNVIFWNSSQRGHLNAEEISEMTKNLKNKEFFLCGSGGFKEGLMDGLIKLGIKKSQIHEEAFDFR